MRWRDIHDDEFMKGYDHLVQNRDFKSSYCFNSGHRLSSIDAVAISSQ